MRRTTGGAAARREWGDLERLLDLADSLAAAWGARARASTTVGRERAVLRLFGVHGLARDGRPLAGQVVDRYVAGRAERLAGGIALPFAMALLEYDVSPQQLALDVASGAVDLAFEAELLVRADRRAVAEQEARRLAAAALERIDANRVARAELVDVLDDAEPPRVGTTVIAPEVGAAVREASRHARDGVDVVRVEVPVGRELADRLSDAGLEVPLWEPGDDPETERRGRDRDLAPTGSQRGLAELRAVLDEVAAARRSYVRLATAAPPLAAPEQAVVAAFERVDLVEADPLAEIVAGRIDPARALADHAFAQRLHRRAGAVLLLGAGPLVVAPDLESGVPSDPSTRGGRALALQLVGAAFARANGLPAGQVVVGGLPDWVTDEPSPAARAAAEVALRRVLFAGHALSFDEPATVPERAALWPFVLGAILAVAGETALVLRRPTDGSIRPTVLATRAAASVAAELTGAFEPDRLSEASAGHARATVAAAIGTLERLRDAGWRAVVGDPVARGRGLGADAVEERTEAFDPFELITGTAAAPTRV